MSYRGSAGISMTIERRKKKKVKCCLLCVNGVPTKNNKELFCKKQGKFKPLYQTKKLTCLVKG